ncbi:uncharacterized protein EDB93DRAFT_1089504 [Suillus bovinus]|uniref:uncharacterized protein n=1 Tax=Suillus bovinus TaxID=48563 RepID=UPI001B877514|nr:uncharacterized protein EDB93DRAFT_1089504 [Suillus bovinus]KAG2141207.1 hypothetical protein EDB93DRAFT_1089504 [Suillus bovinus]
MEITHNLLKKGITFKTLQSIAVPSHAQCPLLELRTYSLGYKCPTFTPVYADYVVYEQYRHEFMNQPHARAALLHGGLVWQLALHSIGFDALPSAINGISQEAVPFGLMLSVNGQTYFDNELLEEEVDFICGTYHICDNARNVAKISWWPRPQAWATSGLNVGFWSTQCEQWFQKHLDNIRDGVSQNRHMSTNDINSLMTSSQWKTSIKFNAGMNKILNEKEC